MDFIKIMCFVKLIIIIKCYGTRINLIRNYRIFLSNLNLNVENVCSYIFIYYSHEFNLTQHNC